MKNANNITFILIISILFNCTTNSYSQDSKSADGLPPEKQGDTNIVPAMKDKVVELTAIDLSKKLAKDAEDNTNKLKVLSRISLDQWEQRVNKLKELEEETNAALNKLDGINNREERGKLKKIFRDEQRSLIQDILKDFQDSELRLKTVADRMHGIQKDFSFAQEMINQKGFVDVRLKDTADDIKALQRDVRYIKGELDLLDQLNPDYRGKRVQFRKAERNLRKKILDYQQIKRDRQFYNVAGKAVQHMRESLSTFLEYADDLYFAYGSRYDQLRAELTQIEQREALQSLNEDFTTLNKIGSNFHEVAEITDLLRDVGRSGPIWEIDIPNVEELPPIPLPGGSIEDILNFRPDSDILE